MIHWLSSLFATSEVKRVSPIDARRRQEGGALLIDVRELDEWKDGHAPNARHIPLGQLSQHLPSLPREREILFICRSGNRSSRATARAEAAGLTATNVAGGMNAWASAGLPIKRG